MKVRYRKGIASHPDPESCGGLREEAVEALTGESVGQPLSREIRLSGVPTLLSEAEGHTDEGATGKPSEDSTRKSIRQTLLRRRHEPIPVLGAWLRRVVQGYFNYHAVPGNIVRMGRFRDQVARSWLFALQRRSQRRRLPWTRFQRLIAFLPWQVGALFSQRSK
jgi:hypothetical protein